MTKYIVACGVPGIPWRIVGIASTGKQAWDMGVTSLLNSRPPWKITCRHENGIPVCVNEHTGSKVRWIPVDHNKRR